MDNLNYYEELSKIIGTNHAKNEFLKALKKYSNSKSNEEYSSTELSPENSTQKIKGISTEEIIEITGQDKDLNYSNEINDKISNDKKIIDLNEEEEEYDIEINNSKSDEDYENLIKRRISRENKKLNDINNNSINSYNYLSKKRENSNSLNINNNYEIGKKSEEKAKKDEQESMYFTPGFSLLLKLVNEFGIDNILSCLCKEKFDKSKKLDSFLEGLMESCGGVKLIFMILKLQFSKLTFNNNLNLLSSLKL